MKKIFQFLFLLAIGGLIAIACSDNFSEKDFLAQQKKLQEGDSIPLTIQIYNGTITAKGSGGNDGRVEKTSGLTGINVTITMNGKKKTAVSDVDGFAIFFVRYPSSISGTLAGTGFATMNFTLSVSVNDLSGILGSTTSAKPLTNASIALPVFENTGARAARVSGTVTAELNLLNNTRENAPNGVTVSFSPNFVGEPFIDQEAVGVAIDKLAFEGVFIATVTNGAYTIDLPTTVRGFPYTYTVSDFTADQTIAIDRFEGDAVGSVRASATIPTVFSMSTLFSGLTDSNFTTVPSSVNSLQIDIDAPPASFTTAATASAPILAPAQVASNFTILAAGSGYPLNSNTIAVTVTPLGGVPTTNAVLYAVSNASGQITGILGNLVDPDGNGPLAPSNYGAGYRGRATLAVGGGSGAIVIANYSSTLETISFLGGAGYPVAPEIVVRGFDVNNNSVEASTGTFINNGSVVNYSVLGQPFSSITSLTFRSVPRVNAVWAVGEFATNVLGQISIPFGDGLIVNGNGSGYNPSVSPGVTVRSIRPGGTGANVFAEMAGGSVNTLVVIDRGAGYSNTPANFPITSVPFTVLTGDDSGSSLKPGVTRNVNFYAGTGTRTRGVN